MILLGGLLGCWAVWRKDQWSRRSRVDDLVRGLCDLNARVASDPDLAALLITFTESPSALTRVERVRARAWFDSARRLHRMLHTALGADTRPESTRSMWVPSMGEAPQPGTSQGTALPDFHSDEKELSNFTLIDPEFMAWVEAMREVRRA
jgi:hypothetical protein